MPLIDFAAKEKALDYTVPAESPAYVIRLDMRAGSTWTRNTKMDKPYDPRFERAMTAAAAAVFCEVPRAVFGYMGSDEITLVVIPYTSEGLPSEYYSQRIQKMASITASVAATAFYREFVLESGASPETLAEIQPAAFDARIFAIEPDEAYAAIRSRQKSVIRNAVRGYAHYKLGDAAIKGKSNHDLLTDGSMPDYETDVPAEYRIGSIIFHDRDRELFVSGESAGLGAAVKVLDDDVLCIEGDNGIGNLYRIPADLDEQDIIDDFEAVIAGRLAFGNGKQSPT